MSRTRVLLIDDTSDGPRFAALLTKTMKVRCRAIGPPASLTKLAMLKQPPDVFLIDFELAQKQEDGTIAPYSGLALAAAVRDKIPTLPIVLVSRGELRKRPPGASYTPPETTSGRRSRLPARAFK